MSDDTIFVVCKDKVDGHIHVYSFEEHLYDKTIRIIKRDALSVKHPLKPDHAIDLIEKVLYMVGE